MADDPSDCVLDLRINVDDHSFVDDSDSFVEGRVDVEPASTRLKKGEVFKNFQEFSDVLDQYCNNLHTPFVTHKSKSIEAYNTRVKNKFPLDFKYHTNIFNCKHFGENVKPLGTGKNNSK